MGITFYIRKRKAGHLYLQIRTDDTNNYVRIESKDEGVALAKRHVEQYFADHIISQDQPKKHGYVYIASNDKLKTLKIGRSKNHPKHRLKTLSQGLPSPFKLEYFVEVEDMFLGEEFVHSSLRYCLVDGAREVFDVSLEKAKKMLDHAEKFVNDQDAYLQEESHRIKF